jgi:ADP-heptose:LPS heptosyltransferase
MILISPYAKILPNGTVNPKNYPFWSELLAHISVPVVQIGVDGEQQLTQDFRKNLSLTDLAKLVNACTTWISCDSFFQHFCWDLGKPGIVLWGQSDPLIFGHPENINLLKDRTYLFHNQFLSWDLIPLRTDCFVEPAVVVAALQKFL